MWKLLSIKPSDQKTKKFVATFQKKEINSQGRTRIGLKHVYFGAAGYEDYTIHKDKNRRTLYRMRHRSDKLNDPTSPGALSYWILWGESTSRIANIRAFRAKYKV